MLEDAFCFTDTQVSDGDSDYCEQHADTRILLCPAEYSCSSVSSFSLVHLLLLSKVFSSCFSDLLWMWKFPALRSLLALTQSHSICPWSLLRNPVSLSLVKFVFTQFCKCSQRIQSSLTLRIPTPLSIPPPPRNSHFHAHIYWLYFVTPGY